MTLSNEFIAIRVNAGENDMGRFSVDTTGGDPKRPEDDNKILIYGHPVPWTSYTTVRIDGESYVFGGPTRRRAGKTGKYGELVSPPGIEDNQQIVTTFQYGDIKVEQILRFGRSPSTKMMDSAKITYRVTNQGSNDHEVGLRIVLDTMLGSNDGAPLLVGDRALDSEEKLAGGEIQDYWQAFDSLLAPTVMAQGTLRSLEFSAPDSIHLANWGKFADNIWDTPFSPGQSFIREGEDIPDTAVALMWNPVSLAPGQIMERSTLYGLGGVTVQPGQIAVGLTAPGEVSTAPGLLQPFTVMGYLFNGGGFDAKNVAATLDLPEGLELVENESAVKNLGDMEINAQLQVSWRVVPTGNATGVKELALKVETDNVEPNEARRPIELMAPPYVTLRVLAPEELFVENQQYRPNPFPVEAVMLNETRTPINNLNVTLVLPEGFEFPVATKPDITIDRLLPQEEYPQKWMVIANGGDTGALTFAVRVKSPNIETQTEKGTIKVPFLEQKIEVDPKITAGAVGETIVIPIRIYNTKKLKSVDLKITYDPLILGKCYIIQRGSIQFNRWNRESLYDCGDGEITIKAEMPDGKPFSGTGIVVNLSFKPSGPGATRIMLDGSTTTNAAGKKSSPQLQNGAIRIKAEPDEEGYSDSKLNKEENK